MFNARVWRGLWRTAATVDIASAAIGGAITMSGSVAGATTTTVPNPDPALITESKPCQPGAGVSEFVDYGVLGSGKVDVSCALTIAAQTSGFKALTDAGFTHTTRPSTPGFPTTITGCPGTDCPVNGTVGSGGTKGIYWSYSLAKAPGDTWVYSGVGGATPKSNGTNDPFQAWSYGGTPPRVPVMDSTGPVTVTPDPEPTSAQAISLAENWMAPSFSAFAAQCAANGTTTCGGGTDYVGELEQYVQALTAAGVAADQIDQRVLAEIRVYENTELLTRGGATTFFLATTTLVPDGSAAGLLSTLVDLRDAGDSTPADGVEMTSLITKMEYAATLTSTGLFPNRLTNTELPTGKVKLTKPTYQGPVASVNALATYAAPALKTMATATKGTGTGIVALVNQILGLAAAVQASSSQVAGGTVTSTVARTTIATDADALVAVQRADGGYNAKSREEVKTTALAGKGLAAAAAVLGTVTVTAAARAASRWLASMQLTSAVVGIRAGSADLGVVAPTAGNFVGYATNGLGYNPATASYVTETGATNGAARLLESDLLDTDWAMLDWALAPYADATVATLSATATTSSATVTASVTAATDPQTISVDYGTTPTLTSAQTAGSVAVAATATQTVTVTLTGPSPNTTYYYRVVATSPIKPVSMGRWATGR